MEKITQDKNACGFMHPFVESYLAQEAEVFPRVIKTDVNSVFWDWSKKETRFVCFTSSYKREKKKKRMKENPPQIWEKRVKITT